VEKREIQRTTGASSKRRLLPVATASLDVGATPDKNRGNPTPEENGRGGSVLAPLLRHQERSEKEEREKGDVGGRCKEHEPQFDAEQWGRGRKKSPVAHLSPQANNPPPPERQKPVFRAQCRAPCGSILRTTKSCLGVQTAASERASAYMWGGEICCAGYTYGITYKYKRI
jgi:hypothetical protein